MAVPPMAGGEACGSFECLAALESGKAEGELSLHCVGDRRAPLRLGRGSVVSKALLGECSEARGELDCCLKRVARLDDPVGETHGSGLLRVDGSTGQDHVECSRLADQAREPDGAAVDEWHAEATAEDAEGGV